MWTDDDVDDDDDDDDDDVGDNDGDGDGACSCPICLLSRLAFVRAHTEARAKVPRTRATQNTADKILRDMIEKFVVTSYAWRYLQVVHAANLPGYY